MSATPTSRRWVGRLLAIGVVVGVAGTATPFTVASAAPATSGATMIGPAPQTGGAGGSGDTGSGDTGSGDTGSGNSGSGNPGSGNPGSGNSGSGNPGSGDTGSGDTGSGDTGSGNSGSGNSGSGNSSGSDDGGVINRPNTPRAPRPTTDPAEEAERKAAEEAAKAQREAEKRARELAEDQAEAAARAARERAEFAEQSARAREAWDSRRRPARMVIVRTDRVEIVNGGRLQTLVPRSAGALTLGTLDRLLPNDWLAIDGDTGLLTATVVLTPGTALEFREDVKNVHLAGGADTSAAASIFTGGGRLTLRGVTVSSVDPSTQQPVPDTAAGRPLIEVSGGGELNATDSTVSGLGNPATPTEGARPGISFNPGSTGSLVRTTLQGNNIGVELSKSRNVNLDGLTVSESSGDGVVLNGDSGTKLNAIRVEKNGGNGLFVGGDTTDRPISGVTSNGNKLYGVVVTKQSGIQVNGIVTEADQAGGLRLNQVTNLTVSDFTATDQPIGIFSHVQSSGIVLDGLKISGGRRAVVIEKSGTDFQVKNSTIEGARVAGVSVGGKHVTLDGVQVSDSQTGVRVERGSGDVQINGLQVSGGRDGIVTSAGATNVTVTDLVANNVGDDAVRNATPNLKIVGGRIDGGTTGLDLAAPTTVTDTTINAASEGIHSRSPEMVRAENISVDATTLGINVSQGTQFVLANSSVHALESVRGQIIFEGTNDVGLPPLSLLSAIGMPLVLLAIILEQVHAFRQRKYGGAKRQMPPVIPAAAAS